MQIDCPTCARTFLVSRDALGEDGRYLLCDFCATRWLVRPTDGLDQSEAMDPQGEDEEILASDEAGAVDPAGDHLFEVQPILAGPDHEDGDHVDSGHFDSGPALAGDLSASSEAHVSWTGDNSGFFAVRDVPSAASRRSLRRPSFQRPKWRLRVFRPATALAACLLVSMGLIGKREAIAKALPGTSAIYAAMGLPVHLRGLEFGNVTTARLDGGTTIAVSGTIHNAARHRNDVPRLTFEIRDTAGLVTASWIENPPKHSLGPEETLAFSAKTTVPEGSKDIAVHFSTEAPAKSLRAIVGQAPSK